MISCLLKLVVATALPLTIAGAWKDPSKALYAGLERGDQCDLRLVCVVSKYGDENLRHTEFMRGIKTLAVLRKNFKAYQLAMALKTGEGDGDCSRLSPGCLQSESDLLQAVEDMGILEKTRFRRSTEDISSRTKRAFPARSVRVNPLLPPNRRQSSQRFPPIMRPEGAQFRGVCRQCDSRSTVCTVYSIGSYAGCTGVWLVAGFPGQIACNVATMPGSIGCGMNTLHCYMEGCGLIRLPRLN